MVGLDIEAGSIAATEIVANGSVQVGQTGIAPLGPGIAREGEITDSEALAAALKDLFDEHKLPRSVRVGLANQRVVVRTLRLPRLERPEEVESAIRFQAPEHIPMPLDQAVLDWQVLEASPEAAEAGQMDVAIVAARRDMVSALTQTLRSAGLKPVGIDVSAFAMIRALGPDVAAADSAAAITLEQEAGDHGPVHRPGRLFCNFGDITNLAVARGSNCLFTRISPFGLEGIAQRLAERRELTLDHSREWLHYVGLDRPLEEMEGDPEILGAARDVLTDGVAKLAGELRLSLDFYSAQDGAIAVEEIVVCGAGSAIEGLASRLQVELGRPMRIGRPSALGGLDQLEAARLTLPYGLALDG